MDYWDIKAGLEFIAKGAGKVKYRILRVTRTQAQLQCINGKGKGFAFVNRASLPNSIAEVCNG